MERAVRITLWATNLCFFAIFAILLIGVITEEASYYDAVDSILEVVSWIIAVVLVLCIISTWILAFIYFFRSASRSASIMDINLFLICIFVPVFAIYILNKQVKSGGMIRQDR